MYGNIEGQISRKGTRNNSCYTQLYRGVPQPPSCTRSSGQPTTQNNTPAQQPTICTAQLPIRLIAMRDHGENTSKQSQ